MKYLPIVLTVLFASAALAGDCGNCASACKQDPATGSCQMVSACSEGKLEVQSLIPGGASEAAGVQEGDVICCYAGQCATTLQRLGELKATAMDEALADHSSALRELDELRASLTIGNVELTVLRGEEQLKMMLPAGQLGVYLKELRPEVVLAEDAVVITGVPAVSWDSEQMNTHLGALAAVCAEQGINIDYDYLTGVSGCAFRTHFFDEWCPSSPEPGVGYDNTVPALAACGLNAKNVAVSAEGKDWPDVRGQVVASINDDMPVLAMNLRGYWQWGVIAGHHQGGEELLCRTYYDRRKGYDTPDQHPFAVMLLSRVGDPPDRIASIENAFRVVVDNLTAEKYDRYYSGLAAFDHWAKRLETDDFQAMDSARLTEVLEGNYWTFTRLANDREAAVRVLGDWGTLMPERKPQFDKLAALYRQEADELGPLIQAIPCPGGLAPGESWPEDVKVRQIAALRKSRELEAEALVTWKELAGAK